MLKRNVLAAAVLATQALVAGAQAAQSEIYKEPELFYAANPVADPAPTDARRKDRARFFSDRPARTPDELKQTESPNDRAQLYFANPY